jgi:hypothetical protein
MCIVIVHVYRMPSQVTGYMQEYSMLSCVARKFRHIKCHRRTQGGRGHVTWRHVHGYIAYIPNDVTGHRVYGVMSHGVMCIV